MSYFLLKFGTIVLLDVEFLVGQSLFSIFHVSPQCSLVPMSSDEKSALILRQDPLQILALYLVFSSLIITCLGVDPFEEFLYLEFVKLLGWVHS